MDFSNISNEDQQAYINAIFKLEELQNKEVLRDDEYDLAYGIASSNNDDELMQKFTDTYIKNSEYTREIAKYTEEIARLTEIVNRINDNEENINANISEEDIHNRATREREYLTKIKNYYSRNNRRVMQNINVDSLSDEEIISTYNTISRVMDNNLLNNIIKSNDNIDDYENTRDNIRLFIKNSDNFLTQLNQIKAGLVLNENINLELNDTIKNMSDELTQLDNEANELINEINNIKNINISSYFEIGPNEINDKIKELKNRFKELKRSQKDKYNSRVEATNKRIDELKNTTNLSSEIVDIINKLSNINTCDVTITKWNQYKYLDLFDYQKLFEMNELISNIDSMLNIKNNTANLDNDIDHIENQFVDILLKFKDEYTNSELDSLKQDVELITNNINELRVKLEENKNKINDEEYSKYLTIITNFEKRNAELKGKLINNENNKYRKFVDEIDDISKEINNLQIIIDALTGNIKTEGLDILKNKLNNYNTNLEDIFNVVKEKHNNKELDDTQYSNLINKIFKQRILTNQTLNKLSKPFIEEESILSSLNGKLDGIEVSIDKLDRQVNILDKPVKNKSIRTKIDGIIKKLTEEINELKSKLVNNYDNTSDFVETQKRIERLEKKLNRVSNNYRKKCPLLVKKVKDSKDFYKKHKKITLIAVGLSIIALIHATVGPIVIPAIMQGNLMIMNKAAGSRTFLSGVNRVLGKSINASEVNRIINTTSGIRTVNVWQLANGVQINPNTASASLLKGIAMSTIGTSILSAPIVVALINAIKKIAEKMKPKEIKNSVDEFVNKQKDTLASGASKTKSNINEKIDELKNKKNELLNHKEKKTIQELYEEYIFNTNGDFDKYCADNELNYTEKEELRKKLIKHGLIDEEDKDKGGR